MRSYSAARGLFSIGAYVGWAAIGLGGLVSLVGFASMASEGFGGGLVLASGILIALVGYFVLVHVQSARASVDTAEYAQQALKLARDEHELSKQMLALAKATPAAATYSAPETTGLTSIRYDTDAAKQPAADHAHPESAPGAATYEPDKLASPATPALPEPSEEPLPGVLASTLKIGSRELVLVDGQYRYGSLKFDDADSAHEYFGVSKAPT